MKPGIRLGGFLPLALFSLALAALAYAKPLQLKTVTLKVPLATTVDQETHTICVPASAWDVILFFFGNYFAHAITVQAMPGEGWRAKTVSVILALLCPTTGIIRALNAIFRRSRLASTELERAARARALCMVVRDCDWLPQDDDVIEGCRIPEMRKTNYLARVEHRGEQLDDVLAADLKHLTEEDYDDAEEIYSWWRFQTGESAFWFVPQKIHGTQKLVAGYKLVYVPSDAVVVALLPASGTDSSKSLISSSYNLPKTLIAVFQTVFAAITLYRSRGRQLGMYGYAAFGLTVTPYLIMSIVNLVAQVLTPDYPAVYLVHTPCMDEAEKRGSQFDGVVGSLGLKESKVELDHVKFEMVSGEVTWKNEEYGNESFRSEDHEYPTYLVTSCDSKGMALDGSSSKKYLAKVGLSSRIDCDYVKPPPLSPIARRKVDRPWKLVRGLTHLFISWALVSLICALSLIIFGVLSGFQPKQSTTTQRSWTMAWLASSILLGPWLHVFTMHGFDLYIFLTTGGIFMLMPAVGGFVVVGKMILEFGDCTRIY